jgi:hypothetical protein
VPIATAKTETPVAPDKQAAQQILRQARSLFQLILSHHKQGFRQVWDNPRATPEEVVAALGTDAAEVFALSGQLSTLLAAAVGNDMKKIIELGIPVGVPENYTYKVNEDGTLTLTKTDEVAEGDGI